MMTLLFHGPSGSGKDTQAELLVEKYNFENIGTGEMIRKMVEEGDTDALKAYEYVKIGKFVPDEIIYKMLPKWVDKYDKNVLKGEIVYEEVDITEYKILSFSFAKN